MKRFLLIVITLTVFQADFLGQSRVQVLSEEQNKDWFASLKNTDLDKQIEIIKSRILKDTAVYNANQYRSDRVIIENLVKEEELKRYGNISEGRIMYILGYENQTTKRARRMNFWWDNWTPTSEIIQLHDILKPKIISSINIIGEKELAMAMYGSRASFGVIMIDFKTNRDFKTFLKIQK